MKRRKRIYGFISLSLLLFTLNGCDSTKTTVEDVMEEIQITEESKLEDATLELDDVILKVGDTSVTYREVLFYIYQAKQRYEEELNKNVWDVILKDGNSFEDYAKEEILRELTEVKVICEEAECQEVYLTDKEKTEVENQASVFFHSVSEEEIETYGFEQDVLNCIFTENAIADKMYAKEKNENKNFEKEYTSWSERCNIEVSVNLWKMVCIKDLK